MRSKSRYDQLEKRVANAEQRLQRQRERLRSQKKILEEVQPAAYRAHTLFEILGAQIASIEERLQALTDKVELGSLDATVEDRAEARSLLAEMRDEHRRIRVRFGVVSRYEERIRRLESALSDEMAAAAQLAREAAAQEPASG